MTLRTSPHIWLAYVPYPVTTAVYLDRALRKRCRVTTVGPPFPQELVETWHLQNLKLPFVDPDVVTEFVPDMAGLSPADPQLAPDLYLWVESVGGYFPENLDALGCPTACWLIDTHLNLAWHLQWAERFDFVFLAQRAYVQKFRDKGMNAHWLPLACDPEIHAPTSLPKKYDLSFVGSLSHNPRRQSLLKRLDEELGIHCERCWWDDMAQVISESKITFNNAVKNDLNMRVFEALSIGTLLLTDPVPESGLETLFHDGEELAIYRSDEELEEVARFYLANPLLQEQIAGRGRQLVLNAHTYDHRADDLLAVALRGKNTTWSAEELRECSVTGLDSPFEQIRQQQICLGAPSRSFVIPVLDYSPASPYNITTLLQDLATIPGEVIVIFNSPAVADDLKGHPRITRSAVMSENIGVARAWNVGISMATTPYVMILNADLHLEAPVIDTIEDGLRRLEQAACVGPQGSFVNYRLTRDFLYFDKGGFDQPIEVDAVSGFLFGIRRELFGPGGLKFEEAYTPCYFEEWDIGLQIRQAGMKSWIIPSTSYDHHWGGSIGGRRQIECLGRSESAQDILQRNRRYFMGKWRNPVSGRLPESGWRFYGPRYAEHLMSSGLVHQSSLVATSLLAEWPDDPHITSVCLSIAFEQGDMRLSTELSKKLHRQTRETEPPPPLQAHIDNPEQQPQTESLSVVLDGVFFQYRITGIARVWEEILRQWAGMPVAQHLLVLDRDGTCPRIAGLRYMTIMRHDYNNLPADRQMLQQICDKERATCFVSTYYSTPLTTPSLLLIHDCIPEALGADLSEPAWQEKRHAINHARSYCTVSNHTKRDLQRYYPETTKRSIQTIHNGISETFTPATVDEINAFREQFGITKPYYLFVGPVEWYKNFTLLLEGFEQLPNRSDYLIVRTRAEELGESTRPEIVTTGRLSDAQLRAAYSGALALVYPSWYEGFGLPVLEAMACGCPVIAADASSIPEVAGNAAWLIPPHDSDAMASALMAMQSPEVRHRQSKAGLEHARQFSWKRTAVALLQAIYANGAVP